MPHIKSRSVLSIYHPGKANIADALSRLNQTTPCDVSGDKIDFVKMVAVQCTPSALSAKQVELASEKDPELISVRQYVTTGDWSKCKLPHYLGVKDELCAGLSSAAAYAACRATDGPMARRSIRFDGTTADRGKSAGCCGLLQSFL